MPYVISCDLSDANLIQELEKRISLGLHPCIGFKSQSSLVSTNPVQREPKRERSRCEREMEDRREVAAVSLEPVLSIFAQRSDREGSREKRRPRALFAAYLSAFIGTFR
jgi:hypothetical protein